MTLLVRAGDEPEGVVPSLFAIIGNIDRRMPVASVHTLDVDVEAGISSERMLGYLSNRVGPRPHTALYFDKGRAILCCRSTKGEAG